MILNDPKDVQPDEQDLLDLHEERAIACVLKIALKPVTNLIDSKKCDT